MRSSQGLVLLLALVFAPLAIALSGLDLALVARALDYEDEVCHPVTENAADTVPPCLNLVTIETVCTPNGTTPLALKAHQQCMCHGSFFDEWPFCLQCLFLHGLRSERDVVYYKSVLSTASNALCEVATPTAPFASVFSSAQAAVLFPADGATDSVDKAASLTAVSLYFTATRSRGPGHITGEATAATATALFTAPPPTTTSGSGPVAGAGAGGGSSASAAPGPNSPNAAGGKSTGASLRSGVVSILFPAVLVVTGVVMF